MLLGLKGCSFSTFSVEEKIIYLKLTMFVLDLLCPLCMLVPKRPFFISQLQNPAFCLGLPLDFPPIAVWTRLHGVQCKSMTLGWSPWLTDHAFPSGSKREVPLMSASHCLMDLMKDMKMGKGLVWTCGLIFFLLLLPFLFLCRLKWRTSQTWVFCSGAWGMNDAPESKRVVWKEALWDELS